MQCAVAFDSLAELQSLSLNDACSREIIKQNQVLDSGHSLDRARIASFDQSLASDESSIVKF